MIFSHWIVFYYSKKKKRKPLLELWGCIFQLLLRWHWEKWNFLLKLIRSQLVRSYLRKNIDSDMTDLRSCRSILRDWKIAKTWNKKVERVMSSHSLRLDVVYTWPFHPAREFYKITTTTFNFVDLGRFDPQRNKNGLIAETKHLIKSPEKETIFAFCKNVWWFNFNWRNNGANVKWRLKQMVGYQWLTVHVKCDSNLLQCHSTKF